MKKLITAAMIAGFAFSAQADDHTMTMADGIKAAMKSDLRTESEMDRDRNRMPVETLEFFGLQGDMKVIELMPGGGWYTKLLAPVLKEKGELIVAIGTGRVGSMIKENETLSHVKVGAEASNLFRKEGARFYSLEKADLGVKKADMVLTFRNYHNFAKDGRMALNDAVWDSLKMGGIYGVVDHTRRHMEGESDENRRRFDPVKAIHEIQQAGFELVDFSDLHYRADDELQYEVGRRSVSGNTDRFTLKFIKVKK